MSELNKVQLFGRVVKDAELKKAGNNVSVAQFSVANNHSYKNKENGEWVNEVDFFPIAIYGAYAEKKVEDLKKGQKIIVEGSLRQNKWEKDGVKHNDTVIRVSSIQIIYDSKKSEPIPATTAEEAAPVEFTEEQLAEMYTSESERLGGTGDDIF